jgi:hypothetical protein
VLDRIGVRGGLTAKERNELRPGAWAAGEVAPVKSRLVTGGHPEERTARDGVPRTEWHTRAER